MFTKLTVCVCVCVCEMIKEKKKIERKATDGAERRVETGRRVQKLEGRGGRETNKKKEKTASQEGDNGSEE